MLRTDGRIQGWRRSPGLSMELAPGGWGPCRPGPSIPGLWVWECSASPQGLPRAGGQVMGVSAGQEPGGGAAETCTAHTLCDGPAWGHQPRAAQGQRGRQAVEGSAEKPAAGALGAVSRAGYSQSPQQQPHSNLGSVSEPTFSMQTSSQAK